MSDRLHQLLDSVLGAPGIGRLREQRFDRSFARGVFSGLCRGVYGTYAEAAKAAPATLPLGYDHASSGDLYHERMDRVYPGDYAAMLWLGKMFDAGATRVFDLGGHVGIGYYAYQKFISYPNSLHWQVLDVPAVAEAGRAIAVTRDTNNRLSFANDFSVASGADVLFTSGALQYLEDTLAQRIASLVTRPKWVLLNLVPMHEQHDFWTVQSIDNAFCPYHVQHAPGFFRAMEQLGYELVDRWENAEKQCLVKFAPEYSVRGYVGAALRLRPT
jgi:putative methyltransferase (TIGR04325 family)